jgi:hypothetical protein
MHAHLNEHTETRPVGKSNALALIAKEKPWRQESYELGCW